jgi:hypothetical protein
MENQREYPDDKTTPMPVATPEHEWEQPVGLEQYQRHAGMDAEMT